MVEEIGNSFDDTMRSLTPGNSVGFCATSWYRCASGVVRTEPGGGSSGNGPSTDPGAKYASFAGNFAKVAAGTPNTFASTSGGVWPIQSLMLNVAYSEK